MKQVIVNQKKLSSLLTLGSLKKITQAMKQINFIYFFLIIFISCSNADREKAEVKNSENVPEKIVPMLEEKKDSTINKVNIENIKMPPIDTNGNAARATEMKKTKVEIKIFRNTDISGFGYDIILDGHTYVHQPNIPALPGNNGFSTEEMARKVAELISFKIHNNIMPPTVEVKELDSLGVR